MVIANNNGKLNCYMSIPVNWPRRQSSVSRNWPPKRQDEFVSRLCYWKKKSKLTWGVATNDRDGFIEVLIGSTNKKIEIPKTEVHYYPKDDVIQLVKKFPDLKKKHPSLLYA